MTRHFGLPKTKRPPFGRAVKQTSGSTLGAQPSSRSLTAPNTLAQSNIVYLPTSRDLNPRDGADLAAAFERRPFHSGGPDIRELATSIFVFSAICLPLIFWGAVIYLFLLP
jgi:hypothetical protein